MPDNQTSSGTVYIYEIPRDPEGNIIYKKTAEVEESDSSDSTEIFYAWWKSVIDGSLDDVIIWKPKTYTKNLLDEPGYIKTSILAKEIVRTRDNNYTFERITSNICRHLQGMYCVYPREPILIGDDYYDNV